MKLGIFTQALKENILQEAVFKTKIFTKKCILYFYEAEGYEELWFIITSIKLP